MTLCVYDDNFWRSFWHRFLNILDFSRKWQKCEISEEYNAKRGSDPSKTFDIRIDCSSNFHVFSEPPPRVHFWRARVPSKAQKCDFGAILGSRGIPKSAIGMTFLAKMASRISARFPPDRSRSRPGRCMLVKTVPRHIFIDLMSILDRFWIDFRGIVEDCSKILVQIVE